MPLSGSALAQQSASEMKPLAVVALSGYDALLEDVNFIGSLSGQPQLAQQVEQMIMLFTQNKGLVGFDKSKPVGAFVQTDGMSFNGALCIPVTSLQKLIEVLAPFGVTGEDQGKGITKISVNGQGQTVFARESNGWALLAPMSQMLENLPADPGPMFSSLTSDYDVGIRLHVQNIPEAYRQLAMQQLQAGMEAGLQPLPGESDEQFEQRKKMTGLQIEQLQRAINEIDELTLGLAIDAEQQRTLLDFTYTAVPDSQLAAQIAENSDPKTNFAGFFQPDAAMMMSFAAKVTEADTAQVEQMFQAVRKQLKTAIDDEEDLPSDQAREVLKSALDDFLDAFQATLKAGLVDGGAVLNLAPDALTFVGGGFVGDPGKVESGLKKLVQLAKEEPDFPGIHWNAESHADVNFHTLSVPIPADEKEPRQLFGDSVDMAIGIGKQSVFFALGRDCLNAAKQVMDLSQASLAKSVPPLEMTIALGQIMDVAASFADGDKKQKIEMVANMLANETNGRDHVRIVQQTVPHGIRVRIEAEEGVLRAIGMAAAQAQGAGL